MRKVISKNSTVNKVLIGVFIFFFIIAVAGAICSAVGVEQSAYSRGAKNQNNQNNQSIGQNGADIEQNNTKSVQESADKALKKKDKSKNGGEYKQAAYVQQAKSGVLLEASTKRVLVDEGMHTRCYPASTTKVLTALVALNKLNLETIVTVPKEAVGVEGSSIYLKVGEKISVQDLLYGLMLRSGNDAAITLAMACSGTVSAFSERMNAGAKECGAINSHFVNPHGLQDENHYSTAYDLAVICAEAYKNENFCKIVNTKIAKIGIGENTRHIGNKNKLLHMFNGANGVKTGFTKASGRCLVGGAKKDGMQLISVVLNYNDMWNDTIRLLNFGFNNYEMIPIELATISENEKAVGVEINAKFSNTASLLPSHYPLRKDKSEFLIIKTA